MGAFPVDPSAATAGLEVVSGLVDVGRDPFPHSRPVDPFQRFVASQASSEDTSERIVGEVLHDLPELIHINVVLYKDEVVKKEGTIGLRPFLRLLGHVLPRVIGPPQF